MRQNYKFSNGLRNIDWECGVYVTLEFTENVDKSKNNIRVVQETK